MVGSDRCTIVIYTLRNTSNMYKNRSVGGPADVVRTGGRDRTRKEK